MSTVPNRGIGFFRMKDGAALLSLPGGETTPPIVYDPETVVWINRAMEGGGTFLSNSKGIADRLIIQLKARSYNSKIIYLLPFLGGNLGTALVPLRDKLNVGAATNANFVQADFAQNRGLQGNGINKTLNSKIMPSALGLGNNGGLGWWESYMTLTGNVQPIGAYGQVGGDQRFILDLRAPSSRTFWWGTNGSPVGSPGTPANGHYYGQRTAINSRQIYFGGTLLATNTVSDAAANSNQREIRIVGCDEAAGVGVTAWPGRGACAYLTDGSLTPSEAADFHSLLRDNLILATGRPG